MIPNIIRKVLLFFGLLVNTLATNAYDAVVNGIYYNLSGSEATVTYRELEGRNNNTFYLENVIIPASFNYNDKTYQVTSIGSRAFMSCKGLTSISIPNSVTIIGDRAFENCTGLKSIITPNSVTVIGENAFMNCAGLKSITISSSVTNIGKCAFFGCTGLTSISVETGNTKYDSRGECNAIVETETNTLITGSNKTIIPNSVTTIGYGAFFRCKGLKGITIPNSVTSIDSESFDGCSSLTNLIIPNSVTSIGYRAFASCTGLTSITIPNSVSDTGQDSFAYCTGLKSITIPNSVTKIGSFSGCTGLTSITIPNSVTNIGFTAFCHCTGLKSITIPNSVTIIEDLAFLDCKALSTSYIPNTVTTIGDKAIKGCSNQMSIQSLPTRIIEGGETEWNRIGLPKEAVSKYVTENKSNTKIIVPDNDRKNAILSSPSNLLNANLSNEYCDAKVFDLKGNVKSCKFSDGGSGSYLQKMLFLEKEITFDKSGKVITTDNLEIKRDEKGKIKEVNSCSISYNKNNQVDYMSYKTFFMMDITNSIIIKYDKNQVYRQSKTDELSEEFEETLFNYTKYDNNGNWTERVTTCGDRKRTERRTIIYY